MSYHIATNDQIESIIKKIFKNFRTVNSQNNLKKLVEKELSKKKKKYGITGNRLRNIALNSNFIKLEIHTREGDPKKLMFKCPVCKSDLQKIKNLTIWGGEVTIELLCKKCGYRTGKKKRIPTRYVFHLKKVT
jgi:DNA topoisomerase IB